jgi:hypothetical protein
LITISSLAAARLASDVLPNLDTNRVLLVSGAANHVAELLREQAFVDVHGYEPRADAKLWPPEDHRRFWTVGNDGLQHFSDDELVDREAELEDIIETSTVFSFEFGAFTVDCGYYLDGDITLVFVVRDQDEVVRHLENTDAKKNYCWTDRPMLAQVFDAGDVR